MVDYTNMGGAGITHIFPIDNADKYKAYIKFTPIIKHGPTYSARVSTSNNETQASSDGLFGELENALSNTFSDFTNSAISGATSSRGNESVALYMPTPVTIQDGVSIEAANLGILGEGISRGMDAGSGILNSLGGALQEGVGSIVDTIKGNLSGPGASLAASRLAAGLPGPGTDAVRGSLRVTPNPNTRMIFRAVNIREFSFDFKMVPTSQSEQVAIQNIVSFFRTNLYPEVIKLEGTGGSTIDAGYKFPNLFEIKLMYFQPNLDVNGNPTGTGTYIDLSETNPNLSFKHMYLRSFSASYNTTGGFYKDGKFNETNITVSFAEEFTLNKSDAMAGMSAKADRYGGADNPYYDGYTGREAGAR